MKSTIINTIIGIVIGIILIILVELGLGMKFLGDTKEDYANEVQSIVHILEESKEPVLQVDYLLAGLTLSPDFQHYLEEGVEKGWWTEEFLTQVTLDDLLPIYGNQLKTILEGVKGTDKAKEIGELLEKIKPLIGDIKSFVSTLDLNQLMYKLSQIRNKVIIAISKVREVSPEVVHVINTVQAIVPKVNGIVTDIKGYLATLNSITGNDVSTFVKDIIGNLDIVDQIEVILGNLGVTIDQAKDKIKEIIEAFGGIEEALAALKEKLLTDVDDDFDFYTVADPNGQVALPNGKLISAKLLNALEIDISDYEYNNNGTPLNFEDDELIVGKISIGFENTSKDLYLTIGEQVISGKNAVTVNAVIPIINENI